MSVKAFCPHRRQKEQRLLLDVETSDRDEEEVKGADCLRWSSSCPACNREHAAALILPCSHTMCVHCVAAGGGTGSGRSPCCAASPPVCSVLCPRCRHAVELPCRTLSSATSCLPKHPSLRSACDGHKKGTEEAASGDQRQHRQGDAYCRDTAQSSLHGSSDSSSSVTPVDVSVDLCEDEMAHSVFGLCFALDPSNVPPCLHLSNSSLTVSYQEDSAPPDHRVRKSVMTSDPRVTLPLPQVCADVVIARGQYYWEVDVCNSSIYRIGVSSLDGSGGWWLERQRSSFFAVYDGSREPLRTVPPHIKSLGVFLNIGGGVLSFHNPVTQEHLATLPTRFHPAGVLPVLGLGQGRLRLRSSLPPPPHVFLSRDSAYRGGACGAGGGQWRGDIPFRSVRKVIQKFEELSVSDPDSTCGSSCSTSTSLPDQGIPGMPPPRECGTGNQDRMGRTSESYS